MSAILKLKPLKINVLPYSFIYKENRTQIKAMSIVKSMTHKTQDLNLLFSYFNQVF